MSHGAHGDPALHGDAHDGPVTPVTPAPWWRIPLLVAGLAALGYGLSLLASGDRATAPVAALVWLGAALLAHDALLAPLAFAGAWLLTRLLPSLPRAASRAVGGGALVAVSLVLVALPALLAPGIDNPTATPRDYGRGLALLLAFDAVVTAAVAVALTVASARRTHGRRRPTVRPGTTR